MEKKSTRKKSTKKKVREKKYGKISTGKKNKNKNMKKNIYGVVFLVHVVISQLMFLAEYPFKRHP
jgi:hypothetical protein